MWPFKKKKAFPARADLVIPSSWDIKHGEPDGKPMFVRVNAGLKDLAGHPEYPFQVGIAVPLREPSPDGLPNRQESQELSDIEDRLVRSLETDRESILAATITTDGMREFVFYTCDWESMKGRFEIIEREVTSHQLQMIVQRDPDWKVFLLLAN